MGYFLINQPEEPIICYDDAVAIPGEIINNPLSLIKKDIEKNGGQIIIISTPEVDQAMKNLAKKIDLEIMNIPPENPITDLN